jgi:hypothetical protein
MTLRAAPLLIVLAVALLDCKSAEAPGARAAEPASGSNEPATQPPSAAPGRAGKRAPCTLGADQTCNDDPKVSALWGRCTELGVCECKSGFTLSPVSKRCMPAP